MNFNELLALRLSLEKLGKYFDGSSPQSDDILSDNFLAAAELAHQANLHYVDKLLARTLELQEQLDATASTQGVLFEMSRTEPANQETMRAVAEAFLQLHNLGAPASQSPEPVESFVPAADLVQRTWAEAQPYRTVLPVEVIAAWSETDRQTAYEWANKMCSGVEIPAPIIVAKRYLEDLSFEDVVDRILLASWVGFTIVADADWSLDLWREVWDWTRAYHLRARVEGSDLAKGLADYGGRVYDELPDMPSIFLPEERLYGQIKAFVNESLGTASIGSVVEQLGGHGVQFAVLAMLAGGEIKGRPGALLFAERSELDGDTDTLTTIVETLGRGDISVTLAVDGAVGVWGGEEEDVGKEAKYMEEQGEEPS